MAWTYFTDPLEEGDLLTIDQYEELLDAFDERLQAAAEAGDADGVHASMDDVVTSALATGQLRRTFNGFLTTSSMPATLENMAPRYLRADTGSTVFTPTTLREDIATALGISATELGAIWTAATDLGLNDFLYWNSVRKGLQLLKTLRLSVDTTVERRTKSGDDSDWATARAEFLAAAESGSGSSVVFVQAGNSVTYSIGGARNKGTVHINAFCGTLGYTAFMFANARVTSSGIDFPINGVLKVTLGTASPVFTALTTPAWPGQTAHTVSGLGASESGDLDVDVRLRGYDEDAYLQAYDPGGSPAQAQCAVTAPSVLMVKPTFTHP